MDSFSSTPWTLDDPSQLFGHWYLGFLHCFLKKHLRALLTLPHYLLLTIYKPAPKSQASTLSFHSSTLAYTIVKCKLGTSTLVLLLCLIPSSHSPSSIWSILDLIVLESRHWRRISSCSWNKVSERLRTFALLSLFSLPGQNTIWSRLIPLHWNTPSFFTLVATPWIAPWYSCMNPLANSKHNLSVMFAMLPSPQLILPVPSCRIEHTFTLWLLRCQLSLLAPTAAKTLFSNVATLHALNLLSTKCISTKMEDFYFTFQSESFLFPPSLSGHNFDEILTRTHSAPLHPSYVAS